MERDAEPQSATGRCSCRAKGQSKELRPRVILTLASYTHSGQLGQAVQTRCKYSETGVGEDWSEGRRWLPISGFLLLLSRQQQWCVSVGQQWKGQDGYGAKSGLERAACWWSGWIIGRSDGLARDSVL
eukprot:superscaffoldBa00002705_g15057